MTSAKPVLVVDDDPMYRLVAIEMLRHMGCSVRAATNGVEALKAASAERFEVVLTNLHMPEMNGLEVARQIRVGVTSGDPPRFIAMLVDGSQAERALCLAEGMSDCIAKPVRIAALERVVLGAPMTEAPRAETGVNEILDADTLDELIMLDEGSRGRLLDGLATAFRNDVPERVEEARWAVGAGDAAIVQTAAQKLRGSAGAIGARRLFVAATRLDTTAARGGFDEIEPILGDIVRESARALGALERVVRQVSQTRR